MANTQSTHTPTPCEVGFHDWDQTAQRREGYYVVTDSICRRCPAMMTLAEAKPVKRKKAERH